MPDVETASVHPSETYQSQTICLTAVTLGFFTKCFGVKVSFIKISSASHTSLNTVNIFLPVLSIFDV
jgi:hypothetical protein